MLVNFVLWIKLYFKKGYGKAKIKVKIQKYRV